ncbi:MAG: ABC transporter ATP-binding protein [Solirubrobacterales bacterium]|nr:ABC transporter ATP-binding protein [Solirubrobacterales bacterium]
MSDEVVQIDKLQVRYGDTVAVQDVSLSIRRGEIFGILGPNGAGKTTTVECVAGLRSPSSGRIAVLGEVGLDRNRLREQVGIQLQSSGLPDKLHVAEAMELFASFYPNPRDPDELLTRLGLEEKRDSRFAKLSGGQRQRLSIALALIGQPQLAILDELTTGLDPAARRETWKVISDIRDQGVTVLLVTHFMEEAEYLCDRVAVFHRGRVIGLDSPGSLAAGAGQKLSFRPKTPLDPAELRGLAGVSNVSAPDGRIEVDGGGDLIASVMEALVSRGVVPLETRVEQSTLDDAFVRMTADEDAAAN